MTESSNAYEFAIFQIIYGFIHSQYLTGVPFTANDIFPPFLPLQILSFLREEREVSSETIDKVKTSKVNVLYYHFLLISVIKLIFYPLPILKAACMHALGFNLTPPFYAIVNSSHENIETLQKLPYYINMESSYW